MYHPTDTALEVQRFEAALISVRKYLNDIYQCMVEAVGMDEAAIFQVQIMMLDDPNSPL